MSCEISGSPEARRLSFTGDLTILEIQKVWEALESAGIEATTSVEADLTNLARIDTSGLQLLWSLARSCRLRWIGLPEAILQTAARTGLSLDLAPVSAA